MYEAACNKSFKCQPANNTSENHDLVVSAHWGVSGCKLDAPAVPSDDVTKEPWLAKAPEPKAPLLPVPVLSPRPEGPPGGAALAEGGRMSCTLGEPVCPGAMGAESPLGLVPYNSITHTHNITRNSHAKSGYPDIQPNNPFLRRVLTPGHGEQHPACGDVRFKVQCPEDIKHYTRLARYNCHRPACPICWPGWAARAADDAASRIEGYQSAVGRAASPRHVTFSPPPGSITTLEDLYDRGNRALRSVGIEAAMVVPHPYRLRRTTADTPEPVPLRSWGNRYTEALSTATWRDRVDFSPHLHAIVYGPLPDPETFQKRTGWVYRNHDQHGPGRSGDELRGTIYYLLSHAWVNGNNAVVRYWFGMSTRKLARIPGETYKEPEPCPVCKASCVVTPPDSIQPDGTAVPFYQDIRNAPVYYVKVKTWEYIVRPVFPAVAGRPGISARALLIWGPEGPPALSRSRGLP